MLSRSGQIGAELARWSDGGPARRAGALGAFRRAAGLPGYLAGWRREGFDPTSEPTPAWERIPLLSKEGLIEAARAEPPFGGRLDVPLSALAHVFVAPGPLYMPFTAADLAGVADSFATAFRACGLTADDLVDQTTMYNWVIAATAIDKALASIGCAVVPGGVGQSERHIEAIRDLRVSAIVAFPTFLEHLLELAAREGRRLPLRKAVVMGELSRPDAKARIAAEHGIVVREFYGVADVGAVAWECEAGDGMHLRDDLLVEFVVPGGSAAADPAPGSPAEIVVTDPHRQAMPIVRLRTGDLVDELRTEPCRCGCPSPRIGRIVGRASEITKVRGMFVVPRQVRDALSRRSVENPFRLVVSRPEGGQDRLTLEIEGESLDGADEIKGLVEQALRLRIDLRLVAALPPGGPRLVDTRLRPAAAAATAGC